MKRASEIKKTSILIIGAGHFGSRAIKILNEFLNQDKSIIVVDKDESRIEGIGSDKVVAMEYEGIRFLIDYLKNISPENIIVPAIPEHLAVEWLITYMKEKEGILYEKTEIPGEVRKALPHTWNGSEGSLLVSYSDFKCPDNCPEPEDHCTVTGEKRETPLYALLENLKINGFKNYIIRSSQLAPGLGGYRAEELFKLKDALINKEADRWLIGTSCRCHGILTGITRMVN